jgi:tRNA G46 methylase TrmB
MHLRQFQAQRMQAPRDFQAIENQPVCVEIGAGKGKHAVLFGQQQPQSKLYAIERTREKFEAMQKQHQLSNLNNLFPIHADALPWITHALYPAQVEQFFILYPNPEPHNPAQRWLNMPFSSSFCRGYSLRGKSLWPAIFLNILRKQSSNSKTFGNCLMKNR